MNPSELWLLAPAASLLVGLFAFAILRAAAAGRIQGLPSTVLWEGIRPTSRRGALAMNLRIEPPSHRDPLLAPPDEALHPTPERAATSAIERHEAALLICRDLGNRRAESEILGKLALAHAALGDSARAVEVYHERLDLARAMGDRPSEASTLDNLSLAYADLGDDAKAQEVHRAAQALFRDLGDKRAIPDPKTPPRIAPADRRDLRRTLESLEHRTALGDPFGFWKNSAPDSRASCPRAVDRSHLYADFERQLGHPEAEKFETYLTKLRKRTERG